METENKISRRVEAVGDSYTKLIQHIRESMGELTFKSICITNLDISISFGNDMTPRLTINLIHRPWNAPDPKTVTQSWFYCTANPSKNGIQAIFQTIEYQKKKIIDEYAELLKQKEKQIKLL